MDPRPQNFELVEDFPDFCAQKVVGHGVRFLRDPLNQLLKCGDCIREAFRHVGIPHALLSRNVCKWLSRALHSQVTENKESRPQATNKPRGFLRTSLGEKPRYSPGEVKE